MSNIVYFGRRDTMVLGKGACDVDALWTLAGEAHRRYPSGTVGTTPDLPWGAIASWHLVPDKNLFLRSGILTLVMERGNSVHSWRSLTATLGCIAAHVDRGRVLRATFDIEDSGFPGWGPATVVFHGDASFTWLRERHAVARNGEWGTVWVDPELKAERDAFAERLKGVVFKPVRVGRVVSVSVPPPKGDPS